MSQKPYSLELEVKILRSDVRERDCRTDHQMGRLCVEEETI